MKGETVENLDVFMRITPHVVPLSGVLCILGPIAVLSDIQTSDPRQGGSSAMVSVRQSPRMAITRPNAFQAGRQRPTLADPDHHAHEG
jgi:hypothetical protein